MRRLLPVLVLATACRASTPSGNGTDGLIRIDDSGIDRATFNQMAAELALPVFWIDDADGDGVPSDAEMARLWGIGGDAPNAADALALVTKHAVESLDDPRLRLLRKELAQGRPTLVQTKLENATAEDRAILDNVLAAAKIVEHIHARQNGVVGMADKIPAEDTLSRAVFYRNQGPWCEAPETQGNTTCTAIAPRPEKISGLYPEAVQKKAKFCDTVAEDLMHHFVVVGPDGAVPYHQAYADDAKKVAEHLNAAAAAIESDDEAAFKAYLKAAANAFLTDEWEAADEAWAKMSSDNSKWYLRIGPDETYFEPCSRKAGFHVSFARIDPSSAAWKAKLDPVKNDMEKAIADLAGEPYAARNVSFDLPDFIDIVLNAGDSRRGLSATIGQSLPNWGPVANEGRGRTVAMMNINTDADSVDAVERQARSVICPSTIGAFNRDPDSLTMSTVLHEAAHNLGPAHEYKVDGKTDDEAFGGPLASTLEELKAETASYFYADWLAAKGIITEEDAKVAHIRDLVWGFGHISRGMYDGDGRPKAYSHLSAIHLGYFIDAGAAKWQAKQKAANGRDIGCLDVDLEKMPSVILELMKTVAGIKARGDKKLATTLVEKYVDAPDRKQLLDTIRERWLREPQPSFVYSIEY